MMVSLNYLFPEVVSDASPGLTSLGVADRLQEVISAELKRLGLEPQWDSTHFFHLGSEIIPDSTRCSGCGTWVIPEEHSHPTSVIASGWTVEDGRILCDQCWSTFDDERISPMD